MWPSRRGEGVPPLRLAGILPATEEQGQGVPNAKYRVGEPQDALATKERADVGLPNAELCVWGPGSATPHRGA